MRKIKLGKTAKYLLAYLEANTDSLHTRFHFDTGKRWQNAVQKLADAGLAVVDMPSFTIALPKEHRAHKYTKI